jgi:hypothetical protein
MLLIYIHSAKVLVSDTFNIGYDIKVIPISKIMSDSAFFSPISEVPIPGSVQYR